MLFLTEKLLDPVSRHSPCPSGKLMQRSDFLFLTYAKQLAYSSRLVRSAGIEPATPWTATRCSIH